MAAMLVSDSPDCTSCSNELAVGSAGIVTCGVGEVIGVLVGLDGT